MSNAGAMNGSSMSKLSRQHRAFWRNFSKSQWESLYTSKDFFYGDRQTENEIEFGEMGMHRWKEIDYFRTQQKDRFQVVLLKRECTT